MGDFHASKDDRVGSQLGATPAGWYDDGSGLLRWWDGRQWTANVSSTAVEVPRSSAHGWWVWSPTYTLGLISFVPALHAALKLKRRALWVWATGLIAGNVVSWSLMSVGPSTPDGNTALGDVGAVLSMALAVLGTIQAFRTRTDVFRPSQADARPLSSIAADPAVVNSLAARQRRAESVALIAGDLGLARDLRIGRPDLTRQYDDGGLVDVDHVPEAVLVSHLGFSRDEARSVITARDHLGGFTSADEICGFAAVPPQALDAVRDRIVTL